MLVPLADVFLGVEYRKSHPAGERVPLCHLDFGETYLIVNIVTTLLFVQQPFSGHRYGLGRELPCDQSVTHDGGLGRH